MRIDQVLAGRTAKIGHNSIPARGDLADLEMRIRECHFFMAMPVVTLEDANRCEDHRHLLSDAKRRADDARKSEKAPHDAKVKAINEAWQPSIRNAEDVIAHLKLLGDAWLRSDATKKRREAEQSVAADMRREVDMPSDVDGTEGEVVVDGTRTMLGTVGRRRSATPVAQMATIADLRTAVIFLAEQEHPEIVAVVQKIADRAARARTSMPGIHIS